MRIQASARRVPKLLKQIRELNARIEQLERQIGQASD
jgi:outer membrane murein-binding lipoprotein Lpp